jgi:hypothetical protein
MSRQSRVVAFAADDLREIRLSDFGGTFVEESRPSGRKPVSVDFELEDEDGGADDPLHDFVSVDQIPARRDWNRRSFGRVHRVR